MIWICTNWTPDWDAISAMSSSAAVVLAVVVWLVDRTIQRQEERKRSRHLALLLLPKLRIYLSNAETIGLRLGKADDDWNALKDSVTPEQLKQKLALGRRDRLTVLQPLVDRGEILPPWLGLGLAKAVSDLQDVEVLIDLIEADSAPTFHMFEVLRGYLADAIESTRGVLGGIRQLMSGRD